MLVDFDTPVDRRESDSSKWKGAGDTLPMYVADMDFLTPKEITEALQKRASQGMFGYMATPDSYYESILQWQETRNHFPIQKEWLYFSPGVVTGLSLAIQALTQAGDQIIIQPPIYPPFYHVVESNNRILLKNTLLQKDGRYEIDFDGFEELAREPKTTLFLLCSPHNPTGRLWSREELQRLADICVANGVTIVSDEIHSDLIYPGKQFIPIASLSREAAEHTVALAAPSKTFNVPGLRHAYAIIPGEENRRRFAELTQRQLHLDQGGIFGYYAAQAGYAHCAYWVDQLMEYVEGNSRFLRSYLAEHLPAVRCFEPEATYLGWIDFSGLGLSEKELEDLLQRAGLRLGAGADFSSECGLYRRITLGCPRSYVEEAMRRLTEAVNR